MINAIVKDVTNLTPYEYTACRRANMGMDGLMQECLQEARGLKYGRVVMLWDDNDHTAAGMVAWALMLPIGRNSQIHTTEYTKRRAKYTVLLWVKKRHRRRGYGTKLMTEIKKIDPRPHVMPHDDRSGEFFSKFHVTTLNYDRQLLKNRTKVA